MSAGMIWYKTQPDSSIASAASDLLTDYCGTIASHDTTVKAEKIAPLLRDILSRSENVIIVGGLDCRSQEENIVFILSRILGIPLESTYRSRSRYCYDRLHNRRLPSLSGSVLFPCRFGGPEGVLLLAGEQSILLLPAAVRAAISVAVSVREFLAPRVAQRQKSAVVAPLSDDYVQKDYEKFIRKPPKKNVTREYDEDELRSVMEQTIRRVHRNDGMHYSESMYDNSNRGTPKRKVSKKGYGFFQ